MNSFRPQLIEAESPVARMDALCEFIEFWLGPRKEEYGEPLNELNARSLPFPLRRLYEFAGRWPSLGERQHYPWAVGAFCSQDQLLRLSDVEICIDGKLKFLVENQGVWDCRTLAEGDDPPVWCCDDDFDEDDECHQARIVCPSLSRFLVTFLLQEMMLGSRLSLLSYLSTPNTGLSEAIRRDWSQTIPVWRNGVYVDCAEAAYFLWNDCLVLQNAGDFGFAANSSTGIEFLTELQRLSSKSEASAFPLGGKILASIRALISGRSLQ